MTIIVIASPGNAPGATTSGFALTLTWPGRAVLAECAPSGGALLSGYFQCQRPPDSGLWNLARAAINGAAIEGAEAARSRFWDQAIPLDADGEHLLLAGLPDPFLSVQISPSTWETIVGLLAELPLTVLADVGAIGPETPFPVLRAADLVLVVMRPTLSQVAAAQPRLARLRQALGPIPLALCLIGNRPYTVRDVRDQLGAFAETYVLPIDVAAARVLSEGATADRERHRIERGELIRVAGQLSARLDRRMHDQATAEAHAAQETRK